ncbi:uncharacterized protein [Hoplias malabaricus]|uniref:uncharacterized protein isoform X2 n=1 Tax=Hoplias malabaricus TaxID=27720 RepID=UPI003461847F
MVLLFGMRLGGWLVFWGSCLMVLVKGNGVCQDIFLGRRNITTELQSDVLLPCIFSADLIRLNTTADIAAVWSKRTVTVDNLMEISLQGEARFWKNYSRHFKTFSKLSVSGDFSILLLNVSHSDEGLYQCDLFNGTNCRIAYQEVQLIKGLSSSLMKYWPYFLGAAVSLFLLLLCLCFVQWKRREGSDAVYVNKCFHENGTETVEEHIYENDTELMEMMRARARHNSHSGGHHGSALWDETRWLVGVLGVLFDGLGQRKWSVSRYISW